MVPPSSIVANRKSLMRCYFFKKHEEEEELAQKQGPVSRHLLKIFRLSKKLLTQNMSVLLEWTPRLSMLCAIRDLSTLLLLPCIVSLIIRGLCQIWLHFVQKMNKR